MTSQAAVDLLIKKGRLEPQVALAVAEAIDTVMTESQLVTVPILDARLAELKADSQLSMMRLENKVDMLASGVDMKLEAHGRSFEAKLEAHGRSFEAKLEAHSRSFEAKLEAQGRSFEAKLELLAANLEKKLEAFKAELVRWVFATMVGCTAVGIAALVIRDLIQHSH